MKNKIIEKREALKASLETLDYQITHLRQHFSPQQVRCWRIRRRAIYKNLCNLPTEAMIQQGAKRINYSNSSKIKSKNETKI
jgi:hypothetical protein